MPALPRLALPDVPLLDPWVMRTAQRLAARRHAGLFVRSPHPAPGMTRPTTQAAWPRTVVEKFLWRKVFDHDPRFTVLSDKLAAKDWVAALGLPVLIPAVRWVGTDAAAIPPALLEEDVVVKANHACGTNLFPRRAGLSRARLVRRANAFLRVDHGRRHHEWGYLGVPRRLFVEDAVGGGAPLHELKVVTFGRLVPRLTHIVDRFGPIGASRWEPGPDGRPLRSDEATSVAPGRVIDADLPPTAPRAIEVAKAIGAHFDHVRVDFLTDGERLWFGEVTVYNRGGNFPDCGEDPDAPLNRAWDIRRAWFARTPQPDPWREAYRRALLRRLAAEPPPAPPASL